MFEWKAGGRERRDRQRGKQSPRALLSGSICLCLKEA